MARLAALACLAALTRYALAGLATLAGLAVVRKPAVVHVLGVFFQFVDSRRNLIYVGRDDFISCTDGRPCCLSDCPVGHRQPP